MEPIFGRIGRVFLRKAANDRGEVYMGTKDSTDHAGVFLPPKTARKIAAELIRLADEIEGVK